jgi:uncharacterized membrane protein HdeD (DUF308 family)
MERATGESAQCQLSPHERLEAWASLGLSERWRWHTAEGACLAFLGIVSLLTATAGGSLLTGAILLGAGSVTLLSVWRAEQYPSFGLSLLLALVALATGFHLLSDPPDTVLGSMFATYFTLRGLLTILLAAAHRRQGFNQWEWFAVSGVTSLILAGLILSGLPGPYVWMLGILLGVHLIFDGSALVAQVLTSEQLSDTAADAALNEPMRAAVFPSGPIYDESPHMLREGQLQRQGEAA